MSPFGYRGASDGKKNYTFCGSAIWNAIVQVLTANIILNAEHTPLVHQFLRLRSQVFVDKLSWSLGTHDGLEFEHYDIFPLAHYVLAVEDGCVIGGARLLRCDTSTGTGTVRTSYMIRDAWRGILDLPSGLCDSEPTTSDRYWEFTRFVIAENNHKIAPAILAATNAFLKTKGADGCLFLGSPAFLRIARKYGYCPITLGSVQRNESGRFIAFKCEMSRN